MGGIEADMIFAMGVHSSWCGLSLYRQWAFGRIDRKTGPGHRRGYLEVKIE